MTHLRRYARFTPLLLAASVLGASVPVASRAEPGGCIKYGAVGAVGGHLAHHGVLGAAGGCAAGMWKRHEYRKGERAKARMYDQEHQQGVPQGGQQGARPGQPGEPVAPDGQF